MTPEDFLVTEKYTPYEKLIMLMKKYAQQEVENALKVASEKATASSTGWYKKGNHIISGTTYVDKESILSAYKVE